MTQFEVEEVGSGIEALLEELQSSLDEPAWERVEELVRLLTELYGAGLARTLELAADAQLVARLGRDEVVGGLLALHGLHPEPLEERARAAVGSVAAVLGPVGARVRLVKVDAASTLVRVSVTGPSTSEAIAQRWEDTVRRAVAEAAPEANVEVLVHAPSPPPAPVAPQPAPVAIRLGPTRVAAGGSR